MTLDEMIAINRTAEKIAEMGMTPPGDEARELAEDMFDVMCRARETLRAQFPRHGNDPAAGNAVMLRAFVKMVPVLEAAQELADDYSDAHIAGMPSNWPIARLIAAVRNYNLLHTDPQPFTEDSKP